MTILTSNTHILNCREYAQFVLSSKVVKPNTRRNWEAMFRKLPLDQYLMPLSDIQAFQIVNSVANQNTRRTVIQMMKVIFQVNLKSPPRIITDLNLPSFEEMDIVVQNSGRYRMYANLMLHAGFRIGETFVKQKVQGMGVLVQSQVIFDKSIQPAKSSGHVVFPTWLLDEYKEWQPEYNNAATILQGLKRHFKKSGLYENVTCHKLRHVFASHYAKLLSIEALRKQMRHSDIKTTMSYYVHVKEGDILDVMHTRKPDLRMVN